MKRNRLFLLGLLLTAAWLGACSRAPRTVPFDELVANPGRYDGEHVCAAGIVAEGFELSALGSSVDPADGFAVLNEPLIWLENASIGERIDCFSVENGGPAYSFCQATVCGRFENCQGCGHLGGYSFQLRGTGGSAPINGENDPVLSEPPQTSLTPEAGAGWAELLFSIPIGEHGLQYQGVGVDEMQITGPNAIAVLPDGSLVLADLLGNRLLTFSPQGELLSTLDLYQLGILNVSDLRTSGEDLYLFEISFDLPGGRYRVNRLTADGRLLSYFDIPAQYRLADNLPGMTLDGSGELVLDASDFTIPAEPGGGQAAGKIIQLTREGTWSPQEVDGLLHHGRLFRYQPDSAAGGAIVAEGLRASTRWTLGLGRLALLEVLSDGRFFVLREDVVQDSPALLVDLSVHLLSPDGEQLAVGRYLLSDALYYVERSLAPAADGSVYALLPERNALHVVRLRLSSGLDPLVPGAQPPYVGK